MEKQEIEEEKLDYAGGFTEDDKKLIDAFHMLHLSPHVESPGDLVDFLAKFGKAISNKDNSSSHTSGSYHFPKLSIFYGEDNKGETSWETFKFEIQSLLADKAFSKEQILLGVRRAVKGNAADIIRRLGPGISLDEVLIKLNSTYGSVETEESVLRKFYSCQQSPKETIASYASRLEELYSQAVSLHALPKNDMVLKGVLYQGLLSEIKHMASYKYDIISDYDKFKIELRKIEADMKNSEPRHCHANVNVEKKPSELDEVKGLLLKINERIDKLEKQQEDIKQGQESYRGNLSGNRYRSNNRDKYQHKQEHNDTNQGHRRPLGSQNFQPTCFGCDGKGHMIKDCPNPKQRQCFNCKKFGHIAKDCPKA